MLATPDTPMKRIRKDILRIKQGDMARIAGVSQATACKWERGTLEPRLSEMARIRDEAARRGIAWDDNWFFDLNSIPPPFHSPHVAAE